MADQKISELAELTTPVAGDLLPMVDVSALETKKVTFAQFLAIVEAALGTVTIDGLDITNGAAHTTFDTLAGEQLVSSTDPDLNILAAVPKWKYAEIDHADASPVDVSGGAPAIIGNIWCTEAAAGTPDFAINDGSTELYSIDTAIALRDAIEVLRGTYCETDLRIVIASAGTAGKIIVQYWPLG